MKSAWLIILLIVLTAASFLWWDGKENSQRYIFGNMWEQARVEAEKRKEDDVALRLMVPPKTKALRIGDEEAGCDIFATDGSGYLTSGKIGGRYGDMLPSELGGLSDSPRILKKGEWLYKVHCSMCHGMDGGGRGSIGIYPGFATIAPFWEEKYNKFPLGQMFNSIVKGQGNMPAFGNRLTVDEVWSIISWVRYLQSLKGNKKS